jgi:hypothetical protein
MFKFRSIFICSFAVLLFQTAGAQNVIFDLSKVKEKSNISTLKFYISDIKVHYTDQTEYSLEKYAYLIDVLDSMHNHFCLNKNSNRELDFIIFNLGIDSTTNVSGAMEGDLDPMNNMYWTWQSGYINIKFEGLIDDGVQREYHLGGYAYPNNALQKVSFKLNKSEDTVIHIHLDDFIHSIPDSIPFKFMTPAPKAVYLSHLFAKCLSSEK